MTVIRRRFRYWPYTLAAVLALSACQQDPAAVADELASANEALPALPESIPLVAGAPEGPVRLAPPADALPAAKPISYARVADTRDSYGYIDRAAAFSDAIGDAPPDYAYDYDDGSEPWGWEAQDDSAYFVEPIDGGYRNYYYAAGSGSPYLVSDPWYSYGYDDDRLVVVYDNYGRALPYDRWPRNDYATRYYQRGGNLYRASRARDRRAVYAARWQDRRQDIAAERIRWNQTREREPQWRDYHAQRRDRIADHWRDERALRVAETQRFDTWRARDFRGDRPALVAAANDDRRRNALIAQRAETERRYDRRQAQLATARQTAVRQQRQAVVERRQDVREQRRADVVQAQQARQQAAARQQQVKAQQAQVEQRRAQTVARQQAEARQQQVVVRRQQTQARQQQVTAQQAQAGQRRAQTVARQQAQQRQAQVAQQRARVETQQRQRAEAQQRTRAQAQQKAVAARQDQVRERAQAQQRQRAAAQQTQVRQQALQRREQAQQQQSQARDRQAAQAATRQQAVARQQAQARQQDAAQAQQARAQAQQARVAQARQAKAERPQPQVERAAPVRARPEARKPRPDVVDRR